MKSSQLLDLESSSSVESEPVVDSGLLVGSLADSQSGSGAELDSGPRSVTDSRMVVDSEHTIGLDFVTADCFWFSILQLTAGSSP